MWEGEVLKAFLLRHRFDIVSYIGYLNCNIARSSGVARSSEGLVYTSGGGKFFPV